MPEPSIAVRAARWPLVIAIVFALAGVGLIATLAARTSAAAVPLILGLTIAWASSNAAGAIIVGTAVDAAARRGRPLDGSRLPIALALASALGLSIVMAAAVGGAVGGALAVVGSGALAAVAKRRHIPSPGLRTQLVLLAIPFLIVTVAREAGVLNVSRTHSQYHTDSHRTSSWNCNASGGASSRLSDYQPAYWMTVDGLGGDIGAALSEMAADQEPADGSPMFVQWMGALDLDSATCHLPLYRAGDVHTELTFTASWSAPTTEVAGGSVTCSVTGTLSLDITASMVGVATCRDLRMYMAKTVLPALHSAVQASMK